MNLFLRSRLPGGAAVVTDAPWVSRSTRDAAARAGPALNENAAARGL